MGAKAAERARLRALLALPAAKAARGLIGCVLVRRRRGKTVEARIVEAEAYLGAADPAAHAYRGRTPRTEPLFGPPGTLYVYFVYGMHHCLNLAVDARGTAGCVLIRAAEPLPGSGLAPTALRGPGRLCRALGIDTRLSGMHVFEAKASTHAASRDATTAGRSLAPDRHPQGGRATAAVLRSREPGRLGASPAGISSGSGRRRA